MENRNYMKSLVKLAFSLFAGMCMIISCDDSNDENFSAFTLDAQEFTLGAEGGTEIVNVTSGTKWVAKASEPWIKVMPANGVGSTECRIVVDSALWAKEVRTAIVTFVPEGQAQQKVEIYQTGFGKMIGLSKEEMSVVNMGDYGKRYFEISVTTNVDFDVNIPVEAKGWIKSKAKDIVLDAGARPRTTKVRFDWEMNTDPEIREAAITFTPKDQEVELEKEAVLKVKQDAAPKIDDNRTGDSIAILLIGLKMKAMVTWDTSEKMDYWAGVTLWEKTDKGVVPEQVGRLRSVSFAMLDTKEVLPSELSHLRYLERLSIVGNGNKMLLPDNFLMGDALAGLKHLKHLQLSGYGITDLLSAELKEPMNTLESIDFSSNHFTAIPSQLNSAKFPKLTSLNLTGMRRHDYNLDLRDDVWQPNWGMRIDVASYSFQQLLKWENLKELRLSYNYLYGQLPEFEDVAPYTDADIADNDTLKTCTNMEKLKSIPRVMPNMEFFAINLNFLTGDVPEWLFYHPRFANFIPFTFIYTQDNGYDPAGIVPRISNEPANLDEYYEFYPAYKAPDKE